MYTLGLDVGTSGTKAIVYDLQRHEVAGRGSVSYDVTSTRPGQAEQDPALWKQACIRAVQEALEGLEASDVKAIGVSGQQHGMVALDATGEVIRPAKLWCDVESTAEAEELSRAYGLVVVPSFTASKLLWLKRHEPKSFDRLATVLLPHDWVNFWLTGRCATDAGDASGTGFWDPVTRRWDRAKADAVDPKLFSCLPELAGPDQAIGSLRAEAAAELGLPAGLAVSPGSGDNAMAALGAGAVDEGSWVVSLGTSGTLFGPSGKPVVDPTGVICAFADATGQWLPLLCTLNCTGATEEVRRAHRLSHAEATELAAAEPPGSHGVTFLPYLVGERTPNWPHATGAILGLRPGLLRPGVLYRAAMEGASFALLEGLARLARCGLAAHELRVVGGGSRNAVWRRVLADAAQLPLRFPAEPEAAALGAALQAAAVHEGVPIAEYVRSHPPPLSAETVHPRAELAGAYREAREHHRRWGEELFGGARADA